MELMAPPLPYRKAKSLENNLLDLLEEKTLDEIISDYVDRIINWQNEDMPMKRYYMNLSLILTKEEISHSIKNMLKRYVNSPVTTSNETEIAFTGSDANPEDYGFDDWAREHVPFVDAAADAAEATRNEFGEWWYDWNGELDQAFFDWIDECFPPDDISSYEGGPGDYPVPTGPAGPASGGAYA